MSSLAAAQCEACRADAPSVSPEETRRFLAELPGWGVVERDGMPRLERVFKFKDFAGALAFTNRVGAAEEQNHHPALLTEWGKVTVGWWTHAIRGLHRNDFIMAAKTSEAADSQ